MAMAMVLVVATHKPMASFILSCCCILAVYFFVAGVEQRRSTCIIDLIFMAVFFLFSLLFHTLYFAQFFQVFFFMCPFAYSLLVVRKIEFWPLLICVSHFKSLINDVVMYVWFNKKKSGIYLNKNKNLHRTLRSDE